MIMPVSNHHHMKHAWKFSNLLYWQCTYFDQNVHSAVDPELLFCLSTVLYFLCRKTDSTYSCACSFNVTTWIGVSRVDTIFYKLDRCEPPCSIYQTENTSMDVHFKSKQTAYHISLTASKVFKEENKYTQMHLCQYYPLRFLKKIYAVSVWSIFVTWVALSQCSIYICHWLMTVCVPLTWEGLCY